MDEEAYGQGRGKLGKLGGKKVGYIIGCKGAFMSLNLIMGPRRGHGGTLKVVLDTQVVMNASATT
jgi:hypothetical protein